MYQDLSLVVSNSLSKLVDGFISFIPSLIIALLVFLAGWLVSVAIGKLVTGILNKIKFNSLFEGGNWREALSKSGLKSDVAGFVGAICKWVLVITFLCISAGILKLDGASEILTNVLEYIPNIIIAVLIFVITVIISDILEKIVRTAVEGMKIEYAHLAGVIVKWSIWVFAAIIILGQLGVAEEFMEILFIGFVGMVALSAGLAFGLGGKDMVADILESLRKKLSGK